MLVDIFGHEYGYTPQQVVDLPITGTFILIDRINNRYKAMSGKDKKEMSIEQLKNRMRKR